MVRPASQYMGLSWKIPLLPFQWIIFPCPSLIIWLLRLCHLFCFNNNFFIQYNDLLNPLCMAFCWYVGRTTRYQALPLVTCYMNSWRQFYSTRSWLLLLLKIKRLTIVTNSWCHNPVNLSITYLKMFQYVTVDGWDVYWTKWNKGWRILFWYSCCWEWCNSVDTVFCDMHVVLKREYKLFKVLSELHKIIIKQWNPYGVTFW